MQYDKISGFSDEIAPEIDIQFAVLQKLGIRYFEPRSVDGKRITLLDDAEVTALKKKMDLMGIRASSIGSPIGKIKIEDSFEEHFTVFKRTVRTAKMLECRYIRLFSFYNDETPWTTKKRDVVLKRLDKMLSYAKQENIILLHENEKGIYGDIAERCLDLMKELFCDNFGAVFDPANFVQCGEDTKEAYRLLSPYIRYMHIKDARFSDRIVVPAGMGDGNLQYILKSLLESGYNGFLSLEPHLGNFKGLEDLETDKLMADLPDGGEGTFALAYTMLCGILETI